MENDLNHSITLTTDLYNKINKKGNDITNNPASHVKWAINKLPVDFLKWCLKDNLENYYAGVETLKQTYKRFKNEI